MGPDDDRESSIFLSSGDWVCEMAWHDDYDSHPGEIVHRQDLFHSHNCDNFPEQAANAALVYGMTIHQTIQKIVSQKWEMSVLHQC